MIARAGRVGGKGSLFRCQSSFFFPFSASVLVRSSTHFISSSNVPRPPLFLQEVGYRWYNAHGVKPLYAFGHGLSYSSFTYSKLSVSQDAGAEPSYNVSLEISNSGKVYAVEVPQLSLTSPASAGEPPLQLRGFDSVALGPGQRATASFALSPRAFSVWDTPRHAWRVVNGTFSVAVGQAVDNLLQHATIDIGSSV